jgi:O-6-methylguanine DNA methyltransferase
VKPEESLPSIWYGEKPSERLGLLWAAVSERGVWSLSYGHDEEDFRRHVLERGPVHLVYDEGKVTHVLQQVDEFLRARRRHFDLQIDWRGMTDFQIAVRRAVAALPYGTTASYGDIAAAVGNPRAARAVGGVQASNPISFLIPCHRVIGADGGLGGYGGYGGLETKAWLLELEAGNR